jgi:hypothetical protein
MFKVGTKVRIVKPVWGGNQLLTGRTGKIIKSGRWLTVKLDDPFITPSGVPYRGAIFPRSNTAVYLEIV